MLGDFNKDGAPRWRIVFHSLKEFRSNFEVIALAGSANIIVVR